MKISQKSSCVGSILVGYVNSLSSRDKSKIEKKKIKRNTMKMVIYDKLKKYNHIDHRNYEMLTSIETVDNRVLSTCFSVACFVR